MRMSESFRAHLIWFSMIGMVVTLGYLVLEPMYRRMTPSEPDAIYCAPPLLAPSGGLSQADHEALEKAEKSLQTLAYPRFPVEKVVVIYGAHPFFDSYYGWTVYKSDGNFFEVHINDKYSMRFQRAVLWHEWGHVLSFFSGVRGGDPHGPHWALGMGTAYTMGRRTPLPSSFFHGEKEGGVVRCGQF